MAIKKILITVKTYPNISGAYEELVCTAGIDNEGNWIRIYPVPYRKLPFSQQYKKYEWIEVDLVRNTKDLRHESYRPKNIEVDEPIKVVGELSPINNWELRKELVLDKAKVYTNLDELVADAKGEKRTSLAVFKPTEILDFYYKEEKERDWPQDKLDLLNQQNLFSDNSIGPAQVVKKLPYKFKYSFTDDAGRNPNLMIEDWELGALYWKELKRLGTEKAACESVKQKFYDILKEKDLYFFLGTTLANHMRAPQPFIIIGVFYPKKEHQLSMRFK
jgi:hypothetical protein